MKNRATRSRTTAAFEPLESRRMMSVTGVSNTVEFVATERQNGARLGVSVAASGNNVVAGAYLSDDLYIKDAGVVRVFNSADGTLVRTLSKPNAASGDYFGHAVAANATHILVGATGDDTGALNAGAAYLFDAVTGQLLATFTNPTPASGDQFGASLAIFGDRVLIGAKGDDTAASNAGAAYLFDLSGNLLTTYLSPNPTSNDYFGSALDGWRGNAVISAYYDDRTGLRSGAVYVYDGTARGLSNAPMHVIDNPTPAGDDHFGVALAVNGDQLVVGADGDDTAGYNSGAAYAFDLSSGTPALAFTMLNPTPGAGDYFGGAVAARGDRILIGASSDDANATNSGAAYVYHAPTGALTHAILNPTAGSGDNFGGAVALLDNDTILVGAMGDDNLQTTDNGAVWAFDLV